MKSPLRLVRESKGQTIVEVGRAVETDPGNLSRIENGKQKASTELAEKLSKHFGGEITEMEILYPERFSTDGDAGAAGTNNHAPH
jgi:transcriptional regulator with XRE-family HTH domain